MLRHELRQKNKTISDSASDLTHVINVVVLDPVPDSCDPLQEAGVHLNAERLKAGDDLRDINCRLPGSLKDDLPIVIQRRGDLLPNQDLVFGRQAAKLLFAQEKDAGGQISDG
jgi:hypothetical protein